MSFCEITMIIILSPLLFVLGVYLLQILFGVLCVVALAILVIITDIIDSFKS